jgi:hypothetical protein
VGVFRRGKYAGGKKVGKGNVANVGDTVKRGQTLGYVEQLGTFVEVKVSRCCWAMFFTARAAGGRSDVWQLMARGTALPAGASMTAAPLPRAPPCAARAPQQLCWYCRLKRVC